MNLTVVGWDKNEWDQMSWNDKECVAVSIYICP